MKWNISHKVHTLRNTRKSSLGSVNVIFVCWLAVHTELLLLRTATSVPLIKESIRDTKNLYKYYNVCKNANGEPGKYTYFEQSTSLHSSHFELVKWYSKHTDCCHSHTSCVILFDLYCLKSMFTQIMFRKGFNLQNTKCLQTTYFSLQTFCVL